ncbi:uncharacterized protein Dere_GG26326 [Drosophila erecta]|nr:uncharacterized protein Dere_GG26326 [Drosophila erecta]
MEEVGFRSVQSVRSATTTIETELLPNRSQSQPQSQSQSQSHSQSEPEPLSEPESSSPGCRQPRESCWPYQMR